MAIPSRQIGRSAKENLLWQISKQLERLTQVAGGPYPPPTTTTTTTIPPVPGNVDIAASTDFDISGDFTIEFFMNMANTDGFPRVYSFGAYPAPNAISIEGSGSIIYFWANGSPLLVGIPGDLGISLVSTWNHIAIVGNGGTATMYINGYNATSSAYGGSIPSGGLPLTIGFGNEPSSYFNGYLASFRWTSSAVYTAPFNGSVPTAPLPNIANCKLLIFEGTNVPMQLSDLSGNGHNAAATGGVNYSTSNPFSPSVPGSLQLGSV
jgi:hypothetical protein